MATVGQDYEPYRKRLKELGIKQTYIRQLDNTFTAQAFITTDLSSNQIIAFHPGAMNFSEKNKVADAKNVKIGMVSPDGRTGMIKHAEQFKKKKIPFIFDPGQGMPMFNGDDLRKFIEQATWVTVNDYEWELLKDRTGWTEKDITSRVDALIITLGGKGSEIHTKDKTYTIPAATPKSVARPDGLRRRVSRRLALRLVEQARLGNHGPHREPHGLDQDRASGPAESQIHARTVQETLQGRVRPENAVRQ